MTRAYNDLKTVSRAAEVLKAFLKAEEWSISGLAREIALHKSVTHRIVSTLTAAGLLVCDARSGFYRLGPLMSQLGEQVERNGVLHRLARPHLVELARKFGETVSVQVVQGDHGLCVDVIESQHPMRMTISPGQSFPLHAGCAGKVILAFHDSAFIERLLSKSPLQSYTEMTITEPDALRAELALIRARGYGFSDGEITPGARSVGAPVLSAQGHVVASLVISGPTVRMSYERMTQQAAALVLAADALSTAIGYSRQPSEGEAHALQQKAG